MGELSFQYPISYVLLCVLVGLVVTGILYARSRTFSDAPLWLKILLPLLRFFATTGIALLLLSPFIKSTIQEESKPILVMAMDKSASISAQQNPDDSTKIDQGWKGIKEQASKKYEVVELTFGSEVYASNMDSTGYLTTDISKVISYVGDNYNTQNLGGLVLATDGIYNEGANPLYQTSTIACPIYTIAQGDTTARKDLYIQNVFFNKIAYLGDKLELQIDVRADNASSGSTQLQIKQKGRIVQQQRVSIKGSKHFSTHKITVPLNQTGIIKYDIELSGIKDESTYSNNKREIYIEVLDARHKILILANGPHPDIAALKRIITQNKNYEVIIKYASKSQDLQLNDYDVSIFHNLPSKKYPLNRIKNNAKTQKTPILYVVGTQTDTRRLNQWQDIVKINAGNTAELIQGNVDATFNSFTLTDEVKKELPTYPPLKGPFGDYTSNPKAKVALKQVIKSIPTDNPLLCLADDSGSRQAVWVGEGIWQWAIHNMRKRNDLEIVGQVIGKTIQQLSLKEDKRKFRVQIAKNIFKKNETILLDGQLYNNNYELINEPEVALNVKDATGKDYTYIFSRIGNYYQLDLGKLPVGTYRYTASTTYQGKPLRTNGSFTVKDVQLEMYDLTARHYILQEMSDRSGGSMVYPSAISSLPKQILESNRSKPLVYTRKKNKALLDFKWLYFALFLALALEWFLRKYYGKY